MSYQQGDTPIKFNTSKEGAGYRSSSDHTRPTGSPRANRDFKKIYRDDRDKDDSEDTAQEVGDAEESSNLIANADLKVAKGKQRPQSIFDLTGQAHKEVHGKTSPKTRTSQANVTAESDGDTPVVADGIAANQAMAEDSTLIAEVTSQQAEVAELPKEKTPFGLRGQEAMGHHRPVREGMPKGSESPNEMFARLSTEGKNAADSTVMGLSGDKKEKFTTRFATEQSDLSYVNPLATSTTTQAPINTAEIKTEPPVSKAAELQALITQIVDKAYQMELDGKTETTVLLKHPPLFAGANLVVTSFDTARGEFNISFENLTQAAKYVLDMQANRDSLKLALEQKGYAVHIVTTTTTPIERAPVVDNPRTGAERDQRGEDQASDDSQQQRRRR